MIRGRGVVDRLLVDLGGDGTVTVGAWPEGGLLETVSRGRLEWPLDEGALEDLRWYLEDYLRAPFGVWEDRGPQIQAQLAAWGEAVFASVFGHGPASDAYQRARRQELELVFRSADPRLLGLPWELMRDQTGPVALNLAGVSRALPVSDLAQATAVPGGRLRVLMVISRPAGTGDIGYRMIARPLLERLDKVRGEVDLVVLRPPTLDALGSVLTEAVAAGDPFHVVHFDGHGALPDQTDGSGSADRPGIMPGSGAEGVLAFERSGGGSDYVAASKIAAVLAEAEVPVVVLNACQSGAVGKDVEAAVATRLLQERAAAVVAMAYSVYAFAAAEFMAVFYEHLFAGDTVSAAVSAGRRRLFQHDGRPSPKGDLPLPDWLVPVHYLRRDVSFPRAQVSRPATDPSMEAPRDSLRTASAGRDGEAADLDPAGVFVGRDNLFYQLEAAVRLRKVAVLHGPAGTGKTELAKAFGRWWRDTGGTDKPEWVLWHLFEPGVASFGLDRVITEIGLRAFGPDFARHNQDQDKRRDRVEKLLSAQRLLLIWDNFETVRSMPDTARATGPLNDNECATLKGFLARLAATGKSAVVITSRAAEGWLGPIARIDVGGLAPDEAIQYASKLLAPYPAAAHRRTKREFGELLQWLYGNPLSMRLVLPHLETTDPGELLAGLQGTAPLPGWDDGQDGQVTSLPASLGYSFAHLDPTHQRLLAAICLFQAIADYEVLEVFSSRDIVPQRFKGVSRQTWRAVLNAAAEAGLLARLGRGMYRIHPALPAYLAAQWRAEEGRDYEGQRADALQALLSAYATLGRWLWQQIDTGDAGFVYTLIGLQQYTMGHLLGYALDRHLWEEAQGIAGSVTRYWESRGLNAEADAWADRVRVAVEDIDGSPPGLDTAAGALWLFMVGAQAQRQRNSGRLDTAERTFHEILAMLQAQPTSPHLQQQIAVAYHQLANVAAVRDGGR
jgi:hypothetical protein